MKRYKVNKIFFSIQGEGCRVGTPQIFIRFSGCNLKCVFCDTQHEDGVMMSVNDILEECKKYASCKSISLCGGEPTLQIDEYLLSMLHQNGYFISIETNGLLPIPEGVDYIVCSPKTRVIAPDNIDELRYVIMKGQKLPEPSKEAKNYFLSPCFDGEERNQENINYCLGLVKKNPKWRIGLQWHKFIGVE